MIQKTLHLLPYISAWFVASMPGDLPFFQMVIKNYLTVGILFFALHRLLRLLTLPKREPDSDSENPLPVRLGVRYYAASLGWAATLLLSLGFLSYTAPPMVLWLTLGLLPLRSLLFRAAQDPLSLRFKLSSLTTETLTAVMSCYIAQPYALADGLVPGTFIQPLLFGLLFGFPFACLLTALGTLQGISAQEREHVERITAAKRRGRRYRKKIKYDFPRTLRERRTASILLFLAPCTICFGATIGLLPLVFTLSALVLPLASRLANSLNLKEEQNLAPASFLRETTGLCILFTAMLLIAGLLSKL